MPRILIVDDDTPLRHAVRRMLTAAGHEVDEAVDGAEALDLCRVDPPDLMLLDVHMPQHDGIQTLTSMVAEELGVRVIAMSGGGWYTKDDALALMRELGAHAMLEKPFEQEELLAVVDGTLLGR